MTTTSNSLPSKWPAQVSQLTKLNKVAQPNTHEKNQNENTLRVLSVASTAEVYTQQAR